MDPQATIDAMLDALRDGDYDEARGYYEDLVYWRRHGGYIPGPK